MGLSITTLIIDLLKGYGIHTEEAYPGGRIPALTGPVAAIRLGRIDRSVRSTAVQITVMSPASQGGAVCESTALQIIEVMEELRATCHMEICRFDHIADVFYIELTAVFSGVAHAEDWTPGPGFSVRIGLQSMDWATGFTVRQQTENGSQWTFTLEEMLGPGSVDPPDPAEPFTITVTRPKTEETLTGCTWTSVEREDTIRGIHQIRSGTAAGRSVSRIL